MSRCFPYPPPGYTLSRAINGALIESMKFQEEQRENDRACRELKKQRKREKKEKESQTAARSSVTEEHGQPLCSNAPRFASSDGTDTTSCNKRKRDSSPSGEHGKIIRIILAPKKQSDSDAVLTPMQIDVMNYNKLIQSWTPPQLQACPDEYLSWLAPSKRCDAVAEKRQKVEQDGVSCARRSALQPRCQYLKEVDLYALPYTVPF